MIIVLVAVAVALPSYNRKVSIKFIVRTCNEKLINDSIRIRFYSSTINIDTSIKDIRHEDVYIKYSQ